MHAHPQPVARLFAAHRLDALFNETNGDRVWKWARGSFLVLAASPFLLLTLKMVVFVEVDDLRDQPVDGESSKAPHYQSARKSSNSTDPIAPKLMMNPTGIT